MGGILTLQPLAEGGEPIKLRAEPHTIVMIMENRFEYALDIPGDSLTLTSFFLREPATYSIESFDGNMDVLNMLGSGPPAPPGEQVSVVGQYCRVGTGADGRFQLWTGVGRASTDGVTEIPFARWDNSPYYDP